MENEYVIGYNISKYSGVISVIKVRLTNEMLKRISTIEQNRFSVNSVTLPAITANKLRFAYG